MILKEADHKHKEIPSRHPNELGIWGIGCTALKELYLKLIERHPQFKIGYYDTKHDDIFNSIASLEQDKVHLLFNEEIKSNHISSFFFTADLLLINSNHTMANDMWLVLDGKKPYKASKIHISQTSCIFYNDQTKALAYELAQSRNNIQLINGCTQNELLNQLQERIIKSAPLLTGLLLTGGNSMRMKENKSFIIYHELPQWLHLYHLLQQQCYQTFVSCTDKTAAHFDGKPVVIDRILGYGPLSGILSALLANKKNAVLVIACDLPLIDVDTLNELIQGRDPSKIATTFFNDESGFLEPLIAIYEPKALPVMLQLLAQGYTCPRKMLLQCDIKILKPKNTKALRNVNHPEEREEIMKQLNKL